MDMEPAMTFIPSRLKTRSIPAGSSPSIAVASRARLTILWNAKTAAMTASPHDQPFSCRTSGIVNMVGNPPHGVR